MIKKTLPVVYRSTSLTSEVPLTWRRGLVSRREVIETKPLKANFNNLNTPAVAASEIARFWRSIKQSEYYTKCISFIHRTFSLEVPLSSQTPLTRFTLRCTENHTKKNPSPSTQKNPAAAIQSLANKFHDSQCKICTRTSAFAYAHRPCPRESAPSQTAPECRENVPRFREHLCNGPRGVTQPNRLWPGSGFDLFVALLRFSPNLNSVDFFPAVVL